MKPNLKAIERAYMDAICYGHGLFRIHPNGEVEYIDLLAITPDDLDRIKEELEDESYVEIETIN